MTDAGSREARFNRLYELHLEAVRAYAWRRVPALADEIAAETFLVAWRRLDDVPEDARPWLIGVARNVRANLQRGDRRREALVERLGSEPPDDGDLALPLAERDALRTALAAVSETDREILLLAAWDGLDRDEIAEALGCTRAGVAVRLFRARRRLESLLAAGDESPAHASGGAFHVRS
ncbi:MAG TPA: sigma-70 family RNA polymerase sigma factor [Gaiellaceae bacterium]|nr:sigma-70 family RNA polymerase sigma factor [Gaiellaceae bacterium]